MTIATTMNTTTTIENTHIPGITFQQVTKTLSFCERAISEQRIKFQQIITGSQQRIAQKNIQNEQLRHDLKLMQERNEVFEAKEARYQQQETEVQYLKRVNSEVQTEMALRKEPMSNEQLYTEITMLRKMNEQLKAENGVLGQANEHMQNKYIEWEHMQHFKTRYFQLSQMIVKTLGLTQTTTIPLSTSTKEQQQRRQSLPSPSLSITSSHSDEESNNYFLIDIHDMEDQIKNKQRQNDTSVKKLMDMQFKLNQVKQELLQERVNNSNFSGRDSIRTKSLQIQLDHATKTHTTLENQNTGLHYKVNELKIKLDKVLNENQEKSKLHKTQQEQIARQEQEICNLKAEVIYIHVPEYINSKVFTTGVS